MKNRRIFAIFMAATIAFQTLGISTAVYGMEAEAYGATAGNAVQAVSPQVYQGENYQVEFHVDTQWQTGYNGRITITNVCEKAIDNWYLSFELADEIQNLQCGTVMEHEGNCYLVKNAGWNKDIPAGGSVSFTFTAAKAGENVIFPAEYSMDTALSEVPSGNYSADFQVQSDWGSGFTSALVITNTSQETISDWKLMFSFAGEITDIGGGQLVMSENGLYELEAYSYDYGIAPGESRYIQIIGSREGTDVVPTDISLMTVEYCVTRENTVPKDVLFEDSALKEELDRMTAANGGTLPVIYLDEEDGIPCFISGRYSDTLVVDFESAVAVLHELTNLMDIDWETVSFTPVHTKAYADRIYYRMQERYEGMEVCQKEIILVTDEAGNVVTLSGDFDPIFDEDTMVAYSEEEAGATAAAELGSIPGRGSLVWYSLERGYDEPAWYFRTDTQAVYISARYGDVLERCDTVAAMNAPVSNPYETPWEYDEERQVYLLTDSVRNIEIAGKWTVFRTAKICEPDGTVQASNYIEKDEDIRVLSGISKWMEKDGSVYLYDVSYSQSGGNRKDAAERHMINAKELFDYYLQTLGIIGYDNQGSLLRIQYETGYANQYNAHADTVNYYYYDTDYFDTVDDDETIKALEKKKMGVIHVGDTYYEQEQFLESIGHEYAHLIEAGAIGGGGLDMGRESGVIKEALADCFQELKDCYKEDESWKNPSRDIASMTARKRDKDGIYSEPMESVYSGETAEGLNDRKKDVHCRSMILSHAVYEMYRSELASAEKMTEWLYRVLYYLPPSATYVNLRCAMEEVAEDMGLDAAIVAGAMEEAGVKIEDKKMTGSNLVKFNIQVVDEKKQPIQNAAVIYKSKYVYYTDENGYVVVSLRNKKTTLFVEKAGYENEEIDYLPNDGYDGYDGYARVQLTSKKRYQSEENSLGSIFGEVRDSENNWTVPLATIVIREGAGNKYGRNIGICTASESGTYTISDLPYGIYTLEVKADGYITQYESVIVGNPLYHAAEMNIILTKSLPEDQARVVLTWGANPRDLDSHLVCYENGRQRWHVFYMCGSAPGISLDVDDTTGYGPETITYKINEDQEYEYYVYWYRGSGTWEISEARVRLYQGDRQIREWNVNIGKEQNISGNRWNVFTMKDGKVQ